MVLWRCARAGSEQQRGERHLPIGCQHCGVRVGQEAGESQIAPAHSRALSASLHTRQQTLQAAPLVLLVEQPGPVHRPEEFTSPAASFFQPARRFWIARGPARAVRYPCARHRGGRGLGDPALYFACRDNYQSPRWGVASYLRPVGSAFLCPLGSALPKRHLAGGSNGWSPTALRSAVRPFPPGLGSPPEPLVQEQETPPSPIGRNRNEPKRERQGARCGWVPCLPNFLPGYQGGASWRGAFSASVTTAASSGGYQGGAQWPGAFLASSLDSAKTRRWRGGSLGL
jgi:hypothetical protein